MARHLRNIAIIAHVDHGKTTLVDKLLQQSGTFAAHQHMTERVMDSNDLEKERGITILAKNCAVDYEGVHINIVDTPGHADFGGEVERVLSMVDGVLLLVDAVEGPMPQTRFVTRKALAQGLKPVVVVNKIDRPGARPDWVVNQTFDLFDKLGATEEQLDFPVVYASALQGYATLDPQHPGTDLRPLFDAVLKYVPERKGDAEGPLQLQIVSLDYSSFVGRIGIGRVHRGRIRTGQEVAILRGPDSPLKRGRVNQILGFKGLERVPFETAEAGDIVLITGIEELGIGVTLTEVDKPEALPMLDVDEPTLTMNFQVNTSPFAGQEGKFVTSRQIRERLERELLSNVALRVQETDDMDIFLVSGRGELHLTILLENMRREGYELAVSRPRVLLKEIDGVRCEPFEALTLDVEDAHQGAVMQALGERRGDLQDMQSDSQGRVRLDYHIPARGLIGFQSEFLTMTRGTGLMSHVFDDYGPMKPEIAARRNGVLISAEQGEAVAYALWKLQERGRMFVIPGDRVYEGMVIGIHSRDNDLVVNPVKTKQLTNIRAAGKDEAVVLMSPVTLTLESAIEFIADDELVEITPQTLRVRKRYLLENDRKRASRS
ncbi:translational GTPase TypA [Ferrovum myxofaciens]|jgi:GTP-binding protein|uniref:Large ribosomal subunit assembly factor BipA n=3 Tax=root TaxID=1 RepID=A0A8F3E3F5_9PROT|nr:translational GTPase TypA [Ferrovum myxofaciens]KXW58188.1 GTP-binding protein TypA/BipA [Ferrovum myxofaciens]MBU6995486.1 translational GTPase TypA [Ferrovum myxofaciens]QKE39265.1 MAG: translational GTPase TypA [Ferrovum myxofaciens]QWY74524.1 MAG: translational GTPase TypA [Ferrovum myxofaciens]QWY77275.1 MAG: translational GTPase TypA [Ferrovum myxofaciens]